MVFESNSSQETYEYGKRIAQEARGSQIYCLIGDLGVGKTVFTQGFAKGIGVEDVVASPTFTIIQEYYDGRMPFYHFDVYRIEDSDQMYEIGYEDYFYGEGVCLVEWANLIEDILPKDVVTITIEKNLDKGLDYRRIIIDGLSDLHLGWRQV